MQNLNKNLNDRDMNAVVVNCTVSLAKRKLKEHYEMGSRSNLSILEVASLKDQILNHTQFSQKETRKVFFNFSEN